MVKTTNQNRMGIQWRYDWEIVANLPGWPADHKSWMCKGNHARIFSFGEYDHLCMIFVKCFTYIYIYIYIYIYLDYISNLYKSYIYIITYIKKTTRHMVYGHIMWCLVPNPKGVWTVQICFCGYFFRGTSRDHDDISTWFIVMYGVHGHELRMSYD